MNKAFDDLLHHSGLIADGCWDELGTYEQEAIERLIDLTVLECCKALWTEECHTSDLAFDEVKRNATRIKKHFGIDPNEITPTMLDAAIEQCKQELAKKKLGVEE